MSERITAADLAREFHGEVEVTDSGGRWVASYRRLGKSCIAVLAGGFDEQVALDALRRSLETWPRLREAP